MAAQWSPRFPIDRDCLLISPYFRVEYNSLGGPDDIGQARQGVLPHPVGFGPAPLRSVPRYSVPETFSVSLVRRWLEASRPRVG